MRLAFSCAKSSLSVIGSSNCRPDMSLCVLSGRKQRGACTITDCPQPLPLPSGRWRAVWAELSELQMVFPQKPRSGPMLPR